jgi:hypothetical protein
MGGEDLSGKVTSDSLNGVSEKPCKGLGGSAERIQKQRPCDDSYSAC